MVVIDRVVCEIKSQVEIPKSVSDCPSSYELVSRPLFDGDQPAPQLGALLLVVVEVSGCFFSAVVARTFVGGELVRTEFLFLRLQIWQHAEIPLVQVAIAVDETP